MNEEGDSDNFKYIGGKLFVNVNQLTAKQRNEILSILKEEKNNSYNSDKFKWTRFSHQKFVVAALAFGIKTVTPKQILSVLHDREPELTREKVGSHLQKFRILVAKQTGIQISNLQNWMRPNGDESELIAGISESWKKAEFQGYSIEEIQKLVQKAK